ncbi:hypothetical protein [Endozoicomonas elysicola]|nr:hypothetical protein [Endozoicomonas elysicola]
MKFFVVILIAVAAFYFYKSDQPEIIIYDGITSENIFEVSGSDSRFQYELEEGFISIDAVAAMTGTNGGLKEGGALLTVHLLNHQAVNKFTETYGQSGLCPAPFFNQYADQKILVAASSVIGEKIASWNLPDYRMSSTWENFTIQGQCIKRLKYGELDGEEMQIPDSFFNNCRMILVNELEHYSL